MPVWRQGVAVGEWRQIAGTSLASAPISVKTYPGLGNTGPDSKVNAWTGFAVDTRDSSVYSAANGGHMDYAGNEVNRIRLSDSAPAWTEVRASTTASQVVSSATHYADGRPASRHSYYGTVVNEVRDRTMVIAGARWGSGSLLGTLDGLNLKANEWDAAATFADIPTDLRGNYGDAMTADKSTGDIYVFSYFNVLRWSSASNIWTRRLASTSIYGQYAASATDTKRNRVFVVGGNVNDQGVYDVAANTVQKVSLSGPNAGSLSGDGNAMVYDPLLDAFLLRKNGAGGTIYRINAQTFSVDTLPNTGGASVPSTSNGVWTRFLYVPKLKGIVYFPTYDGDLWFLRTY